MERAQHKSVGTDFSKLQTNMVIPRRDRDASHDHTLEVIGRKGTIELGFRLLPSLLHQVRSSWRDLLIPFFVLSFFFFYLLE